MLREAAARTVLRTAICSVMPPSREARIGIANEKKFSVEIPIIFRSDEQKMWNDVSVFGMCCSPTVGYE